MEADDCGGAPIDSCEAIDSALKSIISELTEVDATVVRHARDELVCAICGCLFIDPRVLSCQHCFCLRCLFSSVMHERGVQIRVPCAFRCGDDTITTGDIRTVPKNHYVSNLTLLLRRQHHKRARLLQRKERLLGQLLALHAASDAAALTAKSMSDTDRTGTPPLTNTAAAEEAALTKEERLAVVEMLECEWCSASSASCIICHHCASRLCAECRGRFSDHYYLCVESSTPLAPPQHPGSSNGIAAAAAPDLDSPSSDPHRGGGPTADGAMPWNDNGISFDGPTVDGTPVYPFLCSPFFVPALVKEALVRQHATPLQLSDLAVVDVAPLRVAMRETMVECKHTVTGFSCCLPTLPTSSTAVHGFQLNFSLPHLSNQSGEVWAVLDFLSHLSRMGEAALNQLRLLANELSGIVMELSSAARQTYVRHSKGFHLYMLHVWCIARATCLVATSCLLPHLERAGVISYIMSDLVIYHLWVAASRASVQERLRLQQLYASFIKMESLLDRQLEQVIASIDATCRGLATQLHQMQAAMAELMAAPSHRHHRRPPTRRTQNLQQLWAAQTFRRHPTRRGDRAGSSTEPEETLHWQHLDSSADANGATAAELVSTGRSSEVPTPSLDAKARTTPATVSREAEQLYSFLDVAMHHRQPTQTLNRSFLEVLRAFMQVRTFVWSNANQFIRESGIEEEHRRTLLGGEEALQRYTDPIVQSLWAQLRLLFLLEHHQEQAGVASALDVLGDAEVLDILSTALQHTVYDHSKTLEGSQRLSELRGQWTGFSTTSSISIRGPEEHEHFLQLSTVFLNWLVKQQCICLKTIDRQELSWLRLFSGYLQKRRVLPGIHFAPPMTANGLQATEMLDVVVREMLQEYSRGSNGESAQESGDAVVPSTPECLLRGDDKTSEAQRFFFRDFALRDSALQICKDYGKALIQHAYGNTEEVEENDSPPEAAGSLPSEVSHDSEDLLSHPLWESTAQAVQRPGAIHQMLSSPTQQLEGSAASATELQEPHRGGVSVVDTVEDHESNMSVDLRGATAEHAVPPPVLSSRVIDSTRLPNGSSTAAPLSSLILPAQNEMESTVVSGIQATEAAIPSLSGAEQQVVQVNDSAALASISPSPHSGFLFHGDLAPVEVGELSTTTVAADAQGHRKAALLFRNKFHLPAVSVTTRSERSIRLPFYSGRCIYRGASAPFLVDAQSGEVWIDSTSLAEVSKLGFVCRILSSPLFFIVFNSTLSLVVRQRYKLHISFS